MIHPCRILLSNIKEQTIDNIDIHNKIAKSQKICAERSQIKFFKKCKSMIYIYKSLENTDKLNPMTEADLWLSVMGWAVEMIHDEFMKFWGHENGCLDCGDGSMNVHTCQNHRIIHFKYVQFLNL